MRILILPLLLACCSLAGQCQQQDPVPASDRWKGFERSYLVIGGHLAYTVRPAKPLPGNPWVWRASFPDWHTKMDSLLLSRGFHIGYVSVDDQYGSPYAMQIWDRFYRYLVDSLSLAPRVALEAVSRGGLYAYGWARRHPDKITAIYGEAPVCDIRSWPGGKGRGQGAPDSWKQLLEVMGMTEQQALSYKDNPLDDLEGLAAFRVPLIHIIGAKDSIVPNDENTFPLVRRYEELGGPALVYPVTQGPQELGGHHFPIPHAQWWASLLEKASYPLRQSVPPDSFMNVRGGLPNAWRVFGSKQPCTVAFLGGSITYNPGWRDKVCRWLTERFPQTRFRFLAAGIPSLGSLPHAFRLQRDLLDSGKIDLLFVEAAVNDRANGTDSLTQLRALEGIVRQIRKNNPRADVVMMAFADPEKTQDYSRGIIPAEVHNQEIVAGYYQLPSINLAGEVYQKMKLGEFSWQDDFRDLHPSPFGQELYFAAISRLLERCDLPAAPGGPAAYMPAAPLDPNNFEGGRYYPVSMARPGPGWTLAADWLPSDQVPTREGFVHRPMMVTDHPGATLTLPFEGKAIGLCLVSGPDAGILSWSVDNGPFRRTDLFTPWSAQLHLPWYILLSGSLKNKRHLLRLRMEGEHHPGSRGHACRIVYFLVNQKIPS